MNGIIANLMLMAWMATGCVSPPPDAVLAQPASVLQVRITAADPQFLQRHVDANGKITLPLIGSVSVAGQTADQIAEALLKQYDQEHHPDLDITVRILR